MVGKTCENATAFIATFFVGLNATLIYAFYALESYIEEHYQKKTFFQYQ